jgi:hypothetical protein
MSDFDKQYCDKKTTIQCFLSIQIGNAIVVGKLNFYLLNVNKIFEIQHKLCHDVFNQFIKLLQASSVMNENLTTKSY